MNRTIFLIDGFNLCHSLNDACRHLRRGGIKWLNIHKLCNSCIRNITPPREPPWNKPFISAHSRIIASERIPRSYGATNSLSSA